MDNSSLVEEFRKMKAFCYDYDNTHPDNIEHQRMVSEFEKILAMQNQAKVDKTLNVVLEKIMEQIETYDNEKMITIEELRVKIETIFSKYFIW